MQLKVNYNIFFKQKLNSQQEDVYATCEWYKCRVKKLRKDFIGKKRFCSSQCAHAFSGSSGSTGENNKKNIKQEKRMVKKSEPRSKVKSQQKNNKAASDSHEVAEQVEAPVIK